MGTITSRSEFPTTLHVYYALARSLHRGAPNRPGLPPELITTIFRYACSIRPHSSSDFIWELWPDPYPSVRADSHVIQRKLLFVTEALDQTMLFKMATIQLETVSRDQGWASERGEGDSHTWFELGILPRSQSLDSATTTLGQSSPLPDNGAPEADSEQEAILPEVDPDSQKPLAWISHHNKRAHPTFKDLSGKKFGPEHELWEYLEPGDRIGVWMAAQYPAWESWAKWMRIRVREWFVPSFL